MKKNVILHSAIGLLMATAITASTFAATAPALKTQTDQISYIIGYNLGQSFKQQQVAVSPVLLQQGLNDALQDTAPPLTQEQMQKIMQDFQKSMMQKMLEQQNLAADKNAAASTAYIDKIAQQADVIKIEDGLYYKVIKTGNGPTPKDTDIVTVNYKGTLTDGTVFDSSYARNQPATFPLNQVIPGWTAALQKMPVGSTWMIYIAPNLAYGKFAPPSIGPNQALTFKVELLSTKAQAGASSS